MHRSAAHQTWYSAILSGILTQFALYSINLRIMGMSANRSANPDTFKLLITMRSVPKAILTAPCWPPP